MSASVRSWVPVINDELFRKYSYLEFYTFDGGGGFVNRALLGSVKSDEITDLVINQGKLEQFGTLPLLDFRRFERWRTIEKSCWINRCYFLPPLAQNAWLTGDRKLAELVKNTILHFLAQCPPPEDVMAHWERVLYRMEHDYNRKTYEEFKLDETDVEYVWYDFQVASRLINFLHSLYFIKDIADISAAEEQILADGLLTHGRIIFEQESNQPYRPGNHQSVRQAALLHAAAIAPDTPEAQRWIKFAVERGTGHILGDFREDGSLKENAPSYHAFETWHGRDIVLLADRLGHPLVPEALERVNNAGKVLNAYRRPDGKTLAVNDAYPLDADALLESMGIDPAAPEKYTLLKEAGVAVFQGKKFYAALDTSGYTGQFSHYHAGKNALTLYVNGQPFIDDPGCCNYDDPRFRGCKQGEQHSSMLIDGVSDAHSFSIYGFDAYPQVQCGNWHDGVISAVETSSCPQWQGVSWKRTLVCQDAALTVIDNVTAKEAKECTFSFVLAPDVSVKIISGTELHLINGGTVVGMRFANAAAVKIVPAVNFQTDPSRETLRISVTLPDAPDVELKTEIQLL